MEASIDVTTNKEKEEGKKSSWLSWLGFIGSLVLALFVFRFAIGFIVISGNSMNPTFENGNIVVSSNIFYEVERNDIVVYRDANGFDVIKRVIGLPNDRIVIQDGSLFVNGDNINETYITGLSNDMEEIVVPSNSYFVVGDNRTPGESLDSRSSKVGPVHESSVQGEVMISVFPFSLGFIN